MFLHRKRHAVTREPHPALYARTARLFDTLCRPGSDWPADYLRWEIRLLEEMGFGLDLSACAVTGAVEGLSYVSPRTGRAVSRAGAGDWAGRLLPLPAFLVGDAPAGPGALAEGLRLTPVRRKVLEFLLAPALGDRPLPAARARLSDALARRAPR